MVVLCGLWVGFVGMVGLCGWWGSGQWAVGQWIVGVTSFQKIYGLYGLKHLKVEISGDVTKAGRDGTDNQRRKDSATQVDAEFRNKMFLYISFSFWQYFLQSASLALILKLATRLSHFHCHIALACHIGIISLYWVGSCIDQLEARLLIFNQLSYRQTNIIISTKANQDQLREGGRVQRR